MGEAQVKHNKLQSIMWAAILCCVVLLYMKWAVAMASAQTGYAHVDVSILTEDVKERCRNTAMTGCAAWQCVTHWLLTAVVDVQQAHS